METTALEPLGVRVTGLALQEADTAAVEQMQVLLADHGVVVLADQGVDDAGFLAFLRRFGDLVPSAGETPAPGFPDLNVISNVGLTDPPRSTFHVDTSYLAHPPAYTALLPVQLPDQGGQTLFTDQYRAFDTLPADLRQDLEGRSITHVVTGVQVGEDDETSADHPVFRRHPISGRTALYLTTPARCAAVSGMDAARADAVVARLYEHSTTEANTYRHTWSPGDVVMWDNLCVLHRADHSGVVGDRVVHRGMVAGYGNHPAAA